MKKYILLSLVLLINLSVKSQNEDLTKLYEKVNPAVVVIITEVKDVVSVGSITKTVSSEGLGSGFMISDKQLITAAHVVQVAEKLNIKFGDGEIIPAKVITSFNSADVALVELIWPRKNAVTVKLGDSNKAKIGSRVFVVGAPFGLSHSLSSGYVSGFLKDGKTKNPFTISEFIQTDAAINTGNSGGPMFNMDGEVIGIVSNILTKTGGFQGIGFAASSNLAKNLLLEKKKFWSGIEATPIIGRMAEIFNLPQKGGLLVQKVVEYSPLGVLGLKSGDIEMIIENKKILVGGDIILTFNGIKIEYTEEALSRLAKMFEDRELNDPIELTVLRAGKIVTLGRRK
jgi:serine protease Do